MFYVERKKGLCLLAAAMILGITGCGGEAGEGAGEAKDLTEGPGISATAEPGAANEPTPAALPSDQVETLDFFEFPDALMALQQKENQDSPDSAFFCSAAVDGVEFAVIDCCFFEEGAYGSMAEAFLADFPELTSQTKLFLRRTEGETDWEAAVLDYVSENGGCSDPYIAFNSKENGMILFGEEYAYIYVTMDGGTTWTCAESVPEPAGIVAGSVRCLTGWKEGCFLVGHRYKGTPETGQLSLTEDNGKSWKKIELPMPLPGELKYCYSEPFEFRTEGNKLFVKMHMYVEEPDTEAQGSAMLRRKAYYELVSGDGGSTWELANPQEELAFLPVE